jgi:hypothetical protein
MSSPLQIKKLVPFEADADNPLPGTARRLRDEQPDLLVPGAPAAAFSTAPHSLVHAHGADRRARRSRARRRMNRRTRRRRAGQSRRRGGSCTTPCLSSAMMGRRLGGGVVGGIRRRLADLVQGRWETTTTVDLIRAGGLVARRGEVWGEGAGGEEEVPVVGETRGRGGGGGRVPAATGGGWRRGRVRWECQNDFGFLCFFGNTITEEAA